MTDERIIAYLLKELPEEELERFEDECFARESWPGDIDPVEEDLIDDYLRDELPPERRRRFELNYLTSPARRERVRMAAGLLRHVDERAPRLAPTPFAPADGETWFDRLRAYWGGLNWARQATAALALVFVVSGLWWLSRPAGTDPSHSVAKTFDPLVLTISYGNRATGVRAGKAKLPRDGGGLKLLLTLPQTSSPPAAYYRVQLETIDGEIKLSEKVVRENQSIPVDIPAKTLARGQYVVQLFAVGDDGSEQRVGGAGNYYFDIE
jgi:hypothetical protein